jgi:hypothetical protein
MISYEISLPGEALPSSLPDIVLTRYLFLLLLVARFGFLYHWC